jgi:hypothetical protein
MNRLVPSVCLLAALFTLSTAGAAQNRQIGINVLLKSDILEQILADLSTHGTVLNTLPAIDALSMRIAEGELAAHPRAALRRRGQPRRRAQGRAG